MFEKRGNEIEFICLALRVFWDSNGLCQPGKNESVCVCFFSALVFNGLVSTWKHSLLDAIVQSYTSLSFCFYVIVIVLKGDVLLLWVVSVQTPTTFLIEFQRHVVKLLHYNISGKRNKKQKTLFFHWMPFQKNTRTGKQAVAVPLHAACAQDATNKGGRCRLLCLEPLGSCLFFDALSAKRLGFSEVFLVLVSDRCIHLQQMRKFNWLWLGQHGRRAARSIWRIDVQSASGHRWRLFYMHKRLFDGEAHRSVSHENLLVYIS